MTTRLPERDVLSCAEVDDLAGAFVLDALSPEEEQRVLAHLRTCTVDHRELYELREVAALLPLACDEAEPPPALRHRIMLEAVEPRANVVPIGAARAPRWRLYAPLVAAAALLVLAIALGAWNVQLHRQVDSRYQAGRHDELQALLAGGRILPIAGGQGLQLALVVGDNGQAYLTGVAPPPPSGKVYEAWVIKNGTPLPAGTFAPSGGAANANTLSVPLSTPVTGAQKVALTLEPPGGSKQPTGTVLASVDLGS